MAVPGVATTVEGIFELATSAPITTIMIGRRSYALGILSPEAMADLSAWGTRIVDSPKPGGTPLSATDRDPSRILKALLRAGDPAINFKLVLPHLKLIRRSTSN